MCECTMRVFLPTYVTRRSVRGGQIEGVREFQKNIKTERRMPSWNCLYVRLFPLRAEAETHGNRRAAV